MFTYSFFAYNQFMLKIFNLSFRQNFDRLWKLSATESRVPLKLILQVFNCSIQIFNTYLLVWHCTYTAFSAATQNWKSIGLRSVLRPEKAQTVGNHTILTLSFLKLSFVVWDKGAFQQTKQISREFLLTGAKLPLSACSGIAFYPSSFQPKSIWSKWPLSNPTHAMT